MPIRRKIGDSEVNAIGLGCMNLSHGYGPATERKDAERFLNQALDIGYDFFDTASLYGDGNNERLLGSAIMHRRNEFFLASKGVMAIVDGKRGMDGRPEAIKTQCDESLARLNTDHIDLYYMHRLDRKVPVEESIGGLADLVQAGKIGNIGISEMSADTLRRAHAVHPVAAIQSEYSLCTRNPEIAVLDACSELGTAFVAFSPVARGFFSDRPLDPSEFHENDLRNLMPRFNEENYARNVALLEVARPIAEQAGCTLPQLALAWLLASRDNVVPIPGTTNVEHLEQNFRSQDVELSQDAVDELSSHFAPERITGNRYPDRLQRTVDTEIFDFEG
ncbi:MAG: aldo/keto reductase [Gammaproteobacteria bacterium]|nr:aldo/keto reductase [Gammaproteobacteria bacterium]